MMNSNDRLPDDEIEKRMNDALKRALTQPHKPQVDKSPAKAKKKGDGPTAKKNRRPQEV